MKKILIIIVTISSLISGNQIFAQDHPTGLIHLWDLNEGFGDTAYDSVGSNDGNIAGAIWTTGILDAALRFDGDDDFVEAYQINNLPDFSMTVWFKTENIQIDQLLFETALGGIWILGSENSQAALSSHVFENRNGYDAFQYAYLKPTYNVVNQNEWHFAVITAKQYAGNNDQCKIYLDGEFLSDMVWDNSGFSAPHDYTMIGADRWLYGGQVYTQYFFQGIIDEVAVYNRVLTQEEIDQLYQFGNSISAIIDIHPDTLNKKSKGNWLTCYIELPQGYDVASIDISTVLLNGQILAESTPTNIGDYDDDTIPDLMVKFDRSTVQNFLDTGSFNIVLEGSLTDGTNFNGNDPILVIDKGKDHSDEDDHGSVVY